MARKKKHKLRPIESLPHIDGDFQIVSCDLSLTRPGFALLLYHADTRSVEILNKDIIPNKSYTKKKKRGQIIDEIGKMFTEYISPQIVKVVIREKSFVRFNAETAALYCVTGALEMILWNRKEQWFQELAPSSVKKGVTGWGQASKDDVAKAIDSYCTHTNWKADDESDAVAVGIAWLVQNGYMETIPLEQYRERFEKEKVKELLREEAGE